MADVCYLIFTYSQQMCLMHIVFMLFRDAKEKTVDCFILSVIVCVSFAGGPT